MATDWVGVGTVILYFFVSLLLTIIILIYYTNKDPLTWYNYVTIGLTFWICFFSNFLLIVDISSGLNNPADEAPIYYVVLWYIISIVILIQAYMVIPYFQIFSANGQFNCVVRSIVSVVYNIAFFVCTSCLFIIGLILLLVYLIKFAGMGDNDFGQIVKALYNFSMACSMAFGVVIFIFFLSYGISLVPRTLWNRGNLKRSYTHYCFKLAKLSPQIEKHREKLLRTMATIGVLHQKYKEANEPRMMKLIDKLYNKSMKYIDEYDLVVTSGYLNMSKKGIINTFSSPWKLGVLNGRLRANLRRYKCDNYLWQKYLNKALFLEDVLKTRKHHFYKMRIVSPLFRYKGIINQLTEDSNTFDYDIDDDDHKNSYNCCVTLKRLYLRISYFFEWFKFFFIDPIFWRIAAIVMFFVYVLLVWCELNPFLMSISPELNLSPISYLLRGCRSIEPLNQLTNFIFLSVITGTTVYGLFKFKIFRKYILIPHHSDGSSMLFLCVVFCRVCFAILFNYVQLAGVRRDDGIAYFDIMVTMDGLKILWIGKWIISFIPLLIVLLIIIFFFDVLDRCAELCGIERFSFTFSEKNFYVNMNTIKEGLVILEGERKRRYLEMKDQLLKNPDFIEEEKKIQERLIERENDELTPSSPDGNSNNNNDEREGFLEQSYVEKFVDLVVKPKRKIKWLKNKKKGIELKSSDSFSSIGSSTTSFIKRKKVQKKRKKKKWEEEEEKITMEEFDLDDDDDEMDRISVEDVDVKSSTFRAYDEL